MEKSKQTYWAIFHIKEIVFSGTFKQCWDFFVTMGGDQRLSDIIAKGYRIARKS